MCVLTHALPGTHQQLRGVGGGTASLSQVGRWIRSRGRLGELRCQPQRERWRQHR